MSRRSRLDLAASRPFLVPALLAIALLVATAPSLLAQGTRARTFTRQGLLIPDLMLAPGVDARAGRRAADIARDQVGKDVDDKEVEVIDGERLRTAMLKAGYQAGASWLEHDVRALGRGVRADEYLIARVERADGSAGGARIVGELVLMRDARLRQPLPPATGPTLEQAARALGRSIAAARTQLGAQRRCENGLAGGNRAAALEAARAGVAGYPRSTITRVCLLWAMQAHRTPFADVLATAREVLAVDSLSWHALDIAATALDSLRRPAESAALWVRFARRDPTDFDQSNRALWSLRLGGSLTVAESLATELSTANPAELTFARHQWVNAFDNQSWRGAITAAERLLAGDEKLQGDSIFYRRLAAAYRSAGKPYQALEVLARGVARFPGDPRLYSLYAQYVKTEADTVIGRGLAQFPQHGELFALQARDLRSRGRLAEAVDALKLAVAIDSTIPDGPLLLAQAEFELGRPDSALSMLRRALASNADSTRVAQFALARGNTLYRAAHGTKQSSDFSLGLRYLAFADSIRVSPQSRLMVGLAALGVAQTTFAEAVQVKDRTTACTMAQQASDLLPIARSALDEGRTVSTEAVDQSLAHVAQLEPYAVTAIKGFCAAAPR